MTGERVLVVEDEQILREAIRDVLEGGGYTVATAGHGKEALESIEQQEPDVILCDILMPQMDGYEFMARVRSRPEWVSIPVIYVTAKGEQADVRMGRQVGADDYLIKPFEEQDLLVAVRARIDRRAELEAAYDEEMDSLRRSILRVLNHEFRSPLASIAAWTELLSEEESDPGPESFAQLLAGLQDGVRRLGRLVDDFLLLASLQGDQARLEHLEHRQLLNGWQSFLEAAVEPFRKEAAAKRVALSVCCPGDTPAAEVNPVLITEALRRLVDNGIKFANPKGGTVVLAAQGAHDSLRFVVRDDGVGMPEERLSEIFRLFDQVGREETEQQGVGSGLAICREIVRLHGGAIGIESEVGAGTSVTVDLPLPGTANATRTHCSDDAPELGQVIG